MAYDTTYKCLPISYGAKTQLTPEADASELLDEHRKRRIQEIVGLLLYYAQAVDNKLFGSPQCHRHSPIICYRCH